MISLARVRLEVPAATTVEDPPLQDMVTRAVEFLQTQTRRYFGLPVTLTDYLNGSGGRFLWLPEPVAAADASAGLTSSDSIPDIASVEERLYPGATATVLTEDTDFQRRRRGTTDILVRLGSGVIWTLGYEYAVTYERGYLEDEGPKDIEQLILELLKFRFKFASNTGMRSESIGGYSYTRFGDTDLDAIDGARATIEAWRPLVFA